MRKILKKTRFNVITTILMKIRVFGVVAYCRLVRTYRRFGRTFYLYGHCQDDSTILGMRNPEDVGNILLRGFGNWSYYPRRLYPNVKEFS
jgi:hypothetical protein